MKYLNIDISTLSMASHMVGTIGGSRCEQQREPPVDGHRSISVCRIILGEGVETECEQEYGYELFHVVMF
jgi:hypothetical protein